MRTIEEQKQYLHIAKAYVKYEITQAIRVSDASRDDKEIMARIINARYTDDSWWMFCHADDTLKELLMDIIEKTYYGGISDDTAT